MVTDDTALTHSANGWQQQIAELRALLRELRPQLLGAEQKLSEQLIAIHHFELVVRTRLEPLSRRLDKLIVEVEVLQKQLRLLRDSILFADMYEEGELYEAWRSTAEAGSAADGEFRYHQPPPAQSIRTESAEQAEKLKRLYRRLARRFHPDFALNAEDRDYRTGVMMAINAAYTMGDLQRLQELARQPDPQQPDYSDAEMAEALLREVQHCQTRISEIEHELAGLQRHPSYRLMQRTERAAAAGRDLLEELATDLREKIAARLVQRDVLQTEIESVEFGELEFADDAFADAVYNLGLEDVLGEDDESGIADWQDRNRDRFDSYDMDPEAEWDAIRRARKRGRDNV